MNAAITVTGNIGKDVDLKFGGKDNTAIATFSMAHTQRTLKDGQYVNGETMWFRVTTFGNKAETVADTLKKGDSVMVTGTLKQSTYTDKEGKERTSLEITANELALVIKRATKKVEDNLPW